MEVDGGGVVILALPTAVFGVLIGSFLNVVVYRVPRGLSIVAPPSACPGCDTRITARDNVPVLSWLVLRAACRSCGMRISARYPAVELLTGGLFVLAAVHVLGAAPTGSPVAVGLELLAYLHLAAISVALTAIDLDVRRLPDSLVLPAYGVGLLLLGTADVLRDDPVALATACAGSGGAVLLYLALALAKPGGMGLGDVKLAGVLGLFLGQAGAAQLVVGIAAGFLLGGLFGVVLLLTRRAGRSTAMPFGPWMIAGAWVGLLAGEPIARAYLAVTGLA